MNKKKNKIKNYIITLLALIIFVCIGINLRANYLEIIEIGYEYKDIFFIDLKYQYVVFFSIFVFSFLLFSINTKIIKKGLKKFFDEEKKKMPKLPNFSFSFIISLIIGLIGKGFLLDSCKNFINESFFGFEDKVFGNDIGYYIFVMPFIRKILFFIIGVFLLMLVYTAVYYVLALNSYSDGVELESLKKSTFVKQEIAFTIIIVILISALIWLGSTNILNQEMLTIHDLEKTQLIGASMADTTIKLWGYRILSFLIIIDVVVIFKFVKKGNFKKTVITASIIPAYLVGMFICLVYVKNIYLKTNELDKEKNYISYNIENTKKAYGIEIEQKELDDYDTILYGEVLDNKDLINNIPLIDENTVETYIKETQENNSFYKYKNTSISLANYDNNERINYITPRQIITDSNRTYNNKTFEYTHGYSVVETSVSDFDKNGYIQFISSNILEENEKIKQPRIYFGTTDNNIIVVNSKYGLEFDYPISTKVSERNEYSGNAGLNIGFLDRLILGIKNKNVKLAFSSKINKNSKIITNKNIIQRAKKLLPDIIYDNNPYITETDDGRLVWVLDGYTVTNKYPYSQISIIENLNSGDKQKINYIRNSVKVLIDSYNGTVDFYITDKTDPIIMSYNNLYPKLFKFDIPKDIEKQLLYPRYLYEIQANLIGIYHEISEDTLYRGEDIWEITTKTNGKNSEIKPYYTMLRTIDRKQDELGLVITYNKYNKQNIISYLVGTCENGKQELALYKFKSDSNVPGIVQLNSQIEQDEAINTQLKLIDITGTKLIKNIIIVPINNTLLYVEPVYQIMLNEKTQVPVLKKVIVASGNKVSIGDNLNDAINNLFTEESVEISTVDSENVDELLDSIIKANSNLEESMESNDFELMGKDLEKLRELINKLEEIRQKDKIENEEESINQVEEEKTDEFAQ